MITKILLISLLAFALTAFKLPTHQKFSQTLSSKIPQYVGLGYHLLNGNPFSTHIDEGFRSPIFTFTYNNNVRTEDDKYQIPDHTHSTMGISCSIESRVNQYSGTSNYQKQLQKIAKFDSRLSYSFLSASFTYSKAFSQFSNSTESHNQTSYQSNAECTVYTIEMPMYTKQIQFTLDFVEGVKRSYKENSWADFIDHFGTHYASTITFGGRYFLQHTYTESTMSLFTSMNLDIEMAAKIQYLNKIGVNLSEQEKKYQNQTNFVSSKVEVTRLSTLGGTPPQSGNWIDWANTVKQNLAPVQYKLTTLSVLFNFIYGLDVSGAIKSYEDFLNTYCLRVKCQNLTPDRPPPKPLEVSFKKSPQISGVQKSSKMFDTNDGKIKVAMRVNKIIFGSIGSIDSIQFFLTDGIIQKTLPPVGTTKFNHEYEVPKGDEIKCIKFGITYNGKYWKFTSFQFLTKGGVWSQVYSGTYNVNSYQFICLQNNDEHFVGFYGHYGSTFDSIGFNIMKEAMVK